MHPTGMSSTRFDLIANCISATHKQIRSRFGLRWWSISAALQVENSWGIWPHSQRLVPAAFNFGFRKKIVSVARINVLSLFALEPRFFRVHGLISSKCVGCETAYRRVCERALLKSPEEDLHRGAHYFSERIQPARLPHTLSSLDCFWMSISSVRSQQHSRW